MCSLTALSMTAGSLMAGLLVGGQGFDLPNGVVDFHIEYFLAQRRRRPPRVARDAVIHARRVRIAWRPWLADGIANRALDEILSHPRVSAEVEHLRRVGNAGM